MRAAAAIFLSPWDFRFLSCPALWPPSKPNGSNVGSKASSMIKSESGRSAAEDEVGRCSGKPFFTCIMLKTQVQFPYQLAMPTSFYSYLPNADVPVVLTSRNKRWEVRYLGGRSIRRFDGGWKHFAADDNLRIGDGCVFDLMDDKNLRFEVWTLSSQVPSVFASSSGRSNDIPIVIDD